MELFKYADGNGDEKLDGNEFLTMQEPLLTPFKSQFMGMQVAKALTSLDDNRDDMLTRKELAPAKVLHPSSPELEQMSLKEASEKRST